jgi:large subunit ribosomal protein L15
MKLDQLLKIKARSDKRVGRGLGSGKGKTAGRGTKGQKARGSVPKGFIGGTLPLYKKLPMARGRGGKGGHNMLSRSHAVALSLSKLATFKAGSLVNLQSLVEANLVSGKDARQYGVKIVNNGEISVNLTVELPVSKSAAEKIEKAGGKVVNG